MNVKIFLAKGCAPSKQYRTRLDKGYFKFPYNLYDIEEQPDDTDKFEIQAVPCTIILNDDGVEVKRLYGFAPDEKVINIIKAAIGEN